MFPRLALVFLDLLVLAIVGAGVSFYTGSPFALWRHQMAAGAKYMKSLRESDMPAWIERSRLLLAEYHPDIYPVGVYGLADKPVPADLARLNIVRVDIFENRVCYVWMGGMDHTYLEARRRPDDSFTLVAHYNDYQSEIIWPKRPDQAMQPTARRPAVCGLFPRLPSCT